MPAQPAKLLRVHISESDRYHGKPLYEAIVDRCRELGIAGATVFQGLEGYGETAEMHRGYHDRPIVIAIVDSADNIARLVAAIEGMVDTAVMALSDVRALRLGGAAW